MAVISEIVPYLSGPDYRVKSRQFAVRGHATPVRPAGEGGEEPLQRHEVEHDSDDGAAVRPVEVVAGQVDRVIGQYGVMLSAGGG